MSATATHSASSSVVQRVLLMVLRVLVTVVLFATMLVLHLPLKVGLNAITRTLPTVLPLFVPGHLRIARVDALNRRELRVSGVDYRDLDWHWLVEGATVTVRGPMQILRMALKGEPLPPIAVHARKVHAMVPRLTEPLPPGQVAPPSTSTAVIRLPSLTLDADEVINEIQNIPAVGNNAHVQGSLTVGPRDAWALDIASLTTDLHAMSFGAERMVVTANIAHRNGEPSMPRIQATIGLVGTDVNCALRATMGADGALDARADRCEMSAAALDQLASRPPDQPLGITPRIEGLTITGNTNATLALRATVHANDVVLPLEGTISSEQQTLALTFDHFNLHALVDDLPVTDLHGPVRLVHRPLANANDITLDASSLIASVSEVPIPPLTARVIRAGTLLTIQEVRAASIGLDVHGTVDLASGTPNINAHVHLATQSLESLPWVAGLASGAVDATVDVQGVPDGLNATIDTTVDRLRVAGVRVAHGTVAGTARWAHNHANLALAVQADGLARGREFGPVTLRGHVEGDPMGHLEVAMNANGQGLLAALGSSQQPAGPTQINLRATVDRSASGTAIHVAPTNLVLRGARASVQGDVRIDNRGRPSGRVHLDLGDSGAADVALDDRHINVAMRSLNLAWFNTLLHTMGVNRTLSGRVAGTLALGAGTTGGAQGSLELTGFTLQELGTVDATISLTPGAEASRVALSVHSSLGPRIAGDMQVRVPASLGDAEGWFHGLREGQVTLDNITPQSVRPFMPPLMVPTGTVSLATRFSRENPTAPLGVTVELDGTSVGAFVGSPRFSVVRPLRVRALGRFSLPSVSFDAVPVALRLEVGDQERQSRADHGPDSELITDASLFSLTTRLDGPWLVALQQGMRELKATPHPTTQSLSAATRALLTQATTDVNLRIGPILRSDWPLRGVAEAIIQAPNVPAASSFSGRVQVQGPLLALRSRVEVDVSAPSLDVAGLDEPVGVEAVVTMTPAANETLLGPLEMHVEGRAMLSPDAPPAVRRQAAVDVLVATRGSELLERGTQAVTVSRFDVDTDAIPLERFARAHDRGVTGTATVTLRASNNPTQPVHVRVLLNGLRAALRSNAATHATTPPVRTVLDGVVRRENNRWNVHTCIVATASTGEIDCAALDPPAAVTGDPGTTLSVNAMLPFEGNFGQWHFVQPEATAQLRAAEFRLEPFSPFLPADTLSYLGGSLRADVRWLGSDPSTVSGDVRLNDGRVELVTLGEPLRAVNFHVAVANRVATMDTIEADFGRGHVSSHGRATLAANDTALTLAVEARQAPLSQEGNTFGWIDGTIAVDLHIRTGGEPGTDGVEGRINVERASVLMHDESIRTLQPTTLDSAYFVMGRTDTYLQTSSTRDFPIELAVALPNPVWVRRDDFAVAVRGNVTARLDRAGTSLTGNIDQASNQSWFSLLGKRFDIERVSLQFNGGTQIDPSFDIAAVQDSPGTGRITATLGGRLRAPTLTLTSDRYAGASQSEIMAMLVLGRADSPTASSNGDLTDRAQATLTSFLTGATMGLVSTAIGQQLAYRLRPIIETSEVTGTRAGGGFSVSPRLYLEASVSSTSRSLGQGSSSSVSGAEVRTVGEYILTPTLTLSNAFSSGATAAYRWGLDLFWSP